MSTPAQVERHADEADEIYVFWSGEHLGPGAEVICSPSEVAAFFDDGKVLAMVGPGRTALTAATHPLLAPYLERHIFGSPKSISVCFITTTAWPDWAIEVECGRVRPPGDDAVLFDLTMVGVLTVKIDDPAKFAAVLVTAESTDADEGEDGDDDDEQEEDDDQDEEDDGDDDDADDDHALDLLVQKAVRAAVATAILQPPVAVADMARTISEKAPAMISKELGQLLGMSVSAITGLELYRDGQPL